MRTEQQIIDQTNELARQLYAVRGYNTTRKIATPNKPCELRFQGFFHLGRIAAGLRRLEAGITVLQGGEEVNSKASCGSRPGRPWRHSCLGSVTQ